MIKIKQKFETVYRRWAAENPAFSPKILTFSPKFLTFFPFFSFFFFCNVLNLIVGGYIEIGAYI